MLQNSDQLQHRGQGRLSGRLSSNGSSKQPSGHQHVFGTQGETKGPQNPCTGSGSPLPQSKGKAPARQQHRPVFPGSTATGGLRLLKRSKHRLLALDYWRWWHIVIERQMPDTQAVARGKGAQAATNRETTGANISWARARAEPLRPQHNAACTTAAVIRQNKPAHRPGCQRAASNSNPQTGVHAGTSHKVTQPHSSQTRPPQTTIHAVMTAHKPPTPIALPRPTTLPLTNNNKQCGWLGVHPLHHHTATCMQHHASTAPPPQ